MSEIESVKPALTVILDENDFIINSTGPIGKAMAQAVLPLAASARKVTIISDGEMKVMKRNAAAENGKAPVQPPTKAAREHAAAAVVAESLAAGPDVQDAFVSDLEAGKTGEVATGEAGKSPEAASPSKQPSPKRPPRIFQDAAAPPAPELAEAEMNRLLEEAAQAEKDAARVAEDRRYQAQQAIQAGEPVEETTAAVAAEDPAAVKPRTRQRRERNLAVGGRPCGRCGGGGQIVGDAGFVGACPVCHGEGQVKTWDRSLKVR